jgi:diguanylate cyclase (GGDEF)-like protein/PAS domain S-box-containing protein
MPSKRRPGARGPSTPAGAPSGAPALASPLGLIHAILEGSEDVIFVKDAAGRYVHANEAFARYLGCPLADVFGRTDADLFPPEFAARFLEADRRILESGGFERFEETTDFGGRRVTHIGSKFAYKDAGGRPIGVAGIARDITPRMHMERALRESEEQYRRLVETSPDGIWVHREGRTLYANLAMARILGASGPLELVGRSIWDFLPAEARGEVTARIQGAEREGRPAPAVRRTLLRLDGTTIETEVALQPVSFAGMPAVQAVVRDITDRLRAEEALRDTEERYALAAAAANDGLWDWDLRSHVVNYSPRWLAMIGLPGTAAGRGSDLWLDRVHPEDLPRLQAEIDAHLSAVAAHLESTYRVRHEDGTWRWMLTRGLAVRDAAGLAYRLAGSQTDITERKVAEEQLLHDALHDALTGLPNRALFMEELRLAMDRRRRRAEYGFTVLFLDLDRFKVINDSLGHMAGDGLLMSLAARLERCLRPGDRVARLGGDEFTVLLDDIDDVAGATRIADRIQLELAAPFDIGGREVFTSASIGIALSRTGYEDPEAVLRDADLAMYRAKTHGGGRYEVFDLHMHANAVERLELETDLRRAIDRHEFRVVYQPIYGAGGSLVVCFEALVRWAHPRRGLTDPSAFIPVAEETNLTALIGRWVLGEACRQLHEWDAAGRGGPPVSMAVNVSGKQLLASGLVEDVALALRESGIAPGRLCLEITENVLMQDAETAADVLAALSAMGVKLHMDDFGTGYSSLSYLRRFPLDGLKIDRCFVSNMDEPENLELVRTIISLGRNLGLEVIAEGVENAAQWAQLRALGCQLVQGFLFSPPVDAAVALELIGPAAPTPSSAP